eukprot:scaffold5428_cov229-Prasinococcus_capsulatus_cf.AAC.2
MFINIRPASVVPRKGLHLCIFVSLLALVAVNIDYVCYKEPNLCTGRCDPTAQAPWATSLPRLYSVLLAGRHLRFRRSGRTIPHPTRPPRACVGTSSPACEAEGALARGKAAPPRGR